MLLCKYCNYYNGSGNANQASSCASGTCEFTDYVFGDDPEDMETDYPCNSK